ncbi:MAG: hypothetical protein FK733_07375 [Asgard group archaeon]|nr:hypothetical protein [Asgard group archaeon]
MTTLQLSKQKKDLIITYMSCIVESDKEYNLLEEEDCKLFRENIYRLINLIAKTAFDSTGNGVDSLLQELIIDVTHFNQNELSKKKKISTECQLNQRIQIY